MAKLRVYCPDCGSMMLKRSGKSGIFYGCSEYFNTGCKGFLNQNAALHQSMMNSKEEKLKFEGFLKEKIPKSDKPEKYELEKIKEFPHLIKLNFPFSLINKIEDIINEKKGLTINRCLSDFIKLFPKKFLGTEYKIDEDKLIINPDKESEIVEYSDYLKIPYFNPPQSEITRKKYYENDINFIITTPTSSGKTEMASMFMANTIKKGFKTLYLSPLKSVSSEKYAEWVKGHHGFNNYNVSIITGDYALTPERLKELEAADIIIMTSEMLDVRTRRIQSEMNKWLLEARTLVVDESHTISSDSRGPKLEVALMRFTEKNPQCRVILLSATCPNIDQFSNWLTILNGKKTHVIDLPWRPVNLQTHFIGHKRYSSYTAEENEKIDMILEIVRKYGDEGSLLLFVHTIKTGNILLEAIREEGYECDFHNGSRSKHERQIMEDDFRSGELPILVATSSVAYGINL